jgi:hypothetical protein
MGKKKRFGFTMSLGGILDIIDPCDFNSYKAFGNSQQPLYRLLSTT